MAANQAVRHQVPQQNLQGGDEDDRPLNLHQ